MSETWQAITALAALCSVLTAGFVAAVRAIVQRETAQLMDWADRRYARREDVDGLKDALRWLYPLRRIGEQTLRPDKEIL